MLADGGRDGGGAAPSPGVPRISGNLKKQFDERIGIFFNCDHYV